MSFNDIFKSSFLENVTAVSLTDMALALVLSFCLGLFIFFVYKKTYAGVMFSLAFGGSLIAMTMITTMVILAVTSNVVLSLGMVGALSIVRFRTAIKEPMDIAFLFWAIAGGIVLAAGMIPLAIVGSVIIGVIMIVFCNRKSSQKPFIAVISCDNGETEKQVADYLKQNTGKASVNSPIDSPVSSGTTDSRPLISWIFSDEESLEAYHEAYDRFISECIESGWLAEEISRVHDLISPYVESDPSAFYTAEVFEKAVDTLKTFCAKRAESIRGQLEGTIPSTTQGQRADSSSLVDASEISTADMGKMDTGNNQGGGPGGGMPSGGMPSGMPEMGSIPDASQGTMPQGMPDMSSMPDFGSGMSFPGIPGNGGETAESAGTAAQEIPAAAETTESPSAATEENIADSAEQKGPPEGFTGGPPDGGFPGGGSFSGGEYSFEIWTWTAVCVVVLLASVLIIRKTGSHNN